VFNAEVGFGSKNCQHNASLGGNLGIMESFNFQDWTRIGAMNLVSVVAQVSKPAVSPTSKSAARWSSDGLRIWKSATQASAAEQGGAATKGARRLRRFTARSSPACEIGMELGDLER
jgi:hypothetical protein